MKPFTTEWLDAQHQSPTPFAESFFADDGKFSKSKMIALIDEIKTTTETRVAESIRLLPENYGYSLSVNTHMPPHVPHHLSRVHLPHSQLDADTPIALFVKDLKPQDTGRGRKVQDPYEHTVKHYEALLKRNNIDHNITVITLKQLINDHATLEDRRKLSFMYERFLADAKVAMVVNAYLGSKMLQDARIALPIEFDAENLREEIDYALETVTMVYKIFENNGKTEHVRVGRHSMPTEHIVENILDFLRQADMIVPGGTANIMKIVLKPSVYVFSAVELYHSMKDALKVDADAQIKTEPEAGVSDATVPPTAADASVKTEDDIQMTDEEKTNENELEHLLERNYYENVSITGPDYVQDEMDDERPLLYIYYPPDDSPLWQHLARGHYGSYVTPNGRPLPRKHEPPSGKNTTAGSSIMASRNTDDLNRMIMEGLKKVLPQFSQIGGGGGVTANNTIAKKRKNKNKGIGVGYD